MYINDCDPFKKKRELTTKDGYDWEAIERSCLLDSIENLKYEIMVIEERYKELPKLKEELVKLQKSFDKHKST